MSIRGSYHNGFAPRDAEPLYPQLWRGCVGTWAPCLGPSGVVLRDWSGSRNHGTFSGMDAASDWVVTGGRYALDFDGSNDLIEIPSSFSFSNLTDFSVTVWFMAGTQQRGDLFSIGSSSSSNPLFRISINESAGTEDNISAAFRDDSLNEAKYTSGDINVQDGKLHVITASWIAGTKTVEAYYDGLLSGSATSASVGATTLTHSAIGCLRRNTNAIFANAKVLEVTVNRGVMATSEIRLRATRPGIAYETRSRRRNSFQDGGAAANRRRRLLIGAG